MVVQKLVYTVSWQWWLGWRVPLPLMRVIQGLHEYLTFSLCQQYIRKFQPTLWDVTSVSDFTELRLPSELACIIWVENSLLTWSRAHFYGLVRLVNWSLLDGNGWARAKLPPVKGSMQDPQTRNASAVVCQYVFFTPVKEHSSVRATPHQLSCVIFSSFYVKCIKL